MSDLLEKIKELREITSAGFVDCKKALTESNEDIEKAIVILRKSGASKALKKSSRMTNEGVVCINIFENSATIIEINTETDFVAKNSEFLNFAKKVISLSESINKIDDLLEIKDLEENTIKENLTNIISKLGENIIIRRIDSIELEKNTKVFGYVHNKYEKNIGKIASLLKIKADTFDEETIELGKNISMHIAASKPISIDLENLDENIIAKEKLILSESIKSSGKPQEVINKILDGKINKFYEEVVLLEQKYIIDNETKIKKLIENHSKKNKIEIIDYKLFILGD
ncbi:MAG: Elongation factor Ts [Alphaproteobacteria bacterium MarineAlpha5_Bin12]|mgnify:CR=1 FL=1|nr:MAG: Elongation factor Ts [Alphaproteobacteria bacterium MarineAlpha5_Bin12]|tara:strand:- start:66857 stop:67714 length:858 start_codon:yes stop_codon:yes gene_type:complete